MSLTLSLVPPVSPYRGLRTFDAWGAGGFKAPRKKDGEAYTHKGQDYLSRVDDDVPAVMDLEITHLGRAYPDEHPGKADPSDLGSIHFVGLGPWKDLMGKIFYATPLQGVGVGKTFKQGQVIAKAQNRTALATLRDPKRTPMRNHVHFELYVREDNGKWRLVDPCAFVKQPATA